MTAANGEHPVTSITFVTMQFRYLIATDTKMMEITGYPPRLRWLASEMKPTKQFVCKLMHYWCLLMYGGFSTPREKKIFEFQLVLTSCRKRTWQFSWIFEN